MMKSLKQQLIDAGWTGTTKAFKAKDNPVQLFKLLHIPTASFLLQYNVITQKVEPVISNKANVGKIRELYRLGKATKRSTTGKLIECLYFLEEDLTEIKNKMPHSRTSGFFFEFHLIMAIRKKRGLLHKAPIAAIQFTYVLVEN